MNNKKLKDPLYGYICIPTDIMNEIVDSASFQRLRRISQTSYAPLYSSAVHNRFVHSLGVYNLGTLVSNALNQELIRKVQSNELNITVNDIEKISRIFCIACLLHDVGHAPFSHTGEEFYLENDLEYGKLHALLASVVNSKPFFEDIPSEKSRAAAPHEIMSAITGITNFESFLPSNEDKEFFARCITGYKYTEHSQLNEIRNCFIQLLNSKVIDVDKLDYLIRDAYITGYNTVNIDYARLLSSITIVALENYDDGKEQYGLAYYKGAISVIENVVYAHDSERKWIQSHPIILYESYILQHIMKLLSEKLDSDDAKLFSFESLSLSGHELKNAINIRLLSDDDIIFLMKKYYNESPLIAEYFERRKRRHPIWKSEPEYKAFMLGISSGGELLDKLEGAMSDTAKYLSRNSDNCVINQQLIEVLESEIGKIQNEGLDPKTEKTQIQNKELIKKVIKCLINYSQGIQYKGDYVLIKASQFNSGFLKPDFSNIRIVFPLEMGEEIKPFANVASSILGKSSERDDFFYLFYDRAMINGTNPNTNELCKALMKEFL